MKRSIDAVNQKINSILTALQWDRQHLKQWYIKEQAECAPCPNDRRHMVPRDQLSAHTQKCTEKRQGGGARTKRIPSSARYFYTRAPAVVSFQATCTAGHDDGDQPLQNPQSVLVHPMSDDHIRLARELRIKHKRPEAGPGDIHDTIEYDDKQDATAPSDPRASKRRPKTHRVKVTKQRTAIEVQRQLVQAYMHEFK